LGDKHARRQGGDQVLEGQLRQAVPATTAFCEPDEGKPARWHWFALKADEPRPLFAFGGIYRQ